MRILLDTHLVCWHFYEPKRLSKKARQLMLDAEVRFISSASIWEVAIKSRLGKIQADPLRIYERIEEAGFEELPIYARHTVRVASLPHHHTDPFDRLLIAQAIVEPLHLLTVDAYLGRYSELIVQV